ncbi:MAG: four helix bundle protein [Flavobacteriales bacterium]|nr:four helix bundle protein [Flavobacteriales bacterium]
MTNDNKYDLQERLILFAVEIVKLVRKLPSTVEAKYYGGQILRSSGAAALIYAEAQAAESKKDFIHKMGMVLKESRETRVNLRIMDLSGITVQSSSSELQKECNELIAIVFSSIRTAKNRDK